MKKTVTASRGASTHRQQHTRLFNIMREGITTFLEQYNKRGNGDEPGMNQKHNQRWSIEGIRIGSSNTIYTHLSHLCRNDKSLN